MKCSVNLIAVIICVTCMSGVLGSRLLHRHIRSPPPGETLDNFAETCEYCGEVFGSHYTYQCLFDPTFQTFLDCEEGLNGEIPLGNKEQPQNR